ncbi:hypothetical protein N9V56_00825 [Alphaproteobacteria bacterium]|nr:hypothetical protein [Alphaproteobacteria bacterium]
MTKNLKTQHYYHLKMKLFLANYKSFEECASDKSTLDGTENYAYFRPIIDEYFNKDIDAFLDFIKENTEVRDIAIIEYTRLIDDTLEIDVTDDKVSLYKDSTTNFVENNTTLDDCSSFGVIESADLKDVVKRLVLKPYSDLTTTDNDSIKTYIQECDQYPTLRY